MKWKIDNIFAEDTDKYQNLVKRVYFSVSENGNKNTLVYGDVILPDPIDGFIPFSESTEENVIAWTKYALGESSVARYEQLAMDLNKSTNLKLIKQNW
jgi:hypothetical protein